MTCPLLITLLQVVNEGWVLALRESKLKHANTPSLEPINKTKFCGPY